MTMRRYAVILPVLIVLLAAAIFIAASGQEGARAADTKPAATATATPTHKGATGSKDSKDSKDSSSDSWDDSDDDWDDSEEDTDTDGSSGGDVNLGVGETENVAVVEPPELGQGHGRQTTKATRKSSSGSASASRSRTSTRTRRPRSRSSAPIPAWVRRPRT